MYEFECLCTGLQSYQFLNTLFSGEGDKLKELMSTRVPPGVDEAAYVKAAFLAAVAKGEATSPLYTPVEAVKLLGTMQVALRTYHFI